MLQEIFLCIYEKTKDSCWIVRVQTQLYVHNTDVRAAQKEFKVCVFVAESHQNWENNWVMVYQTTSSSWMCLWFTWIWLQQVLQSSHGLWIALCSDSNVYLMQKAMM